MLYVYDEDRMRVLHSFSEGLIEAAKEVVRPSECDNPHMSSLIHLACSTYLPLRIASSGNLQAVTPLLAGPMPIHYGHAWDLSGNCQQWP